MFLTQQPGSETKSSHLTTSYSYVVTGDKSYFVSPYSGPSSILCFHGILCFRFVFSPHSFNLLFSVVTIANGSYIHMNGRTSLSRFKGGILRHVRLFVLGFDKVISSTVGDSSTIDANAHVSL